MRQCHEHGRTNAAGQCRLCHQDFCHDCLVYAYGRLKPPYCLHCALVVNGLEPADADDDRSVTSLAS